MLCRVLLSSVVSRVCGVCYPVVELTKHNTTQHWASYPLKSGQATGAKGWSFISFFFNSLPPPPPPFSLPFCLFFLCLFLSLAYLLPILVYSFLFLLVQMCACKQARFRRVFFKVVLLLILVQNGGWPKEPTKTHISNYYYDILLILQQQHFFNAQQHLHLYLQSTFFSNIKETH